jgi:hypothetical protein
MHFLIARPAATAFGVALLLTAAATPETGRRVMPR